MKKDWARVEPSSPEILDKTQPSHPFPLTVLQQCPTCHLIPNLIRKEDKRKGPSKGKLTFYFHKSTGSEFSDVAKRAPFLSVLFLGQ